MRPLFYSTGIAALVAAAGGVPAPYDSDLEFRRYHHRDLPDLTDEALEGERVLVLLAHAALVRNPLMVGGDREREWFTARRMAVLNEVARRERGDRRR